MITKFITWILSFFIKSSTPELDKEIAQKKDKLKELDKELLEEYDNVEDSMKEWK